MAIFDNSIKKLSIIDRDSIDNQLNGLNNISFNDVIVYLSVIISIFIGYGYYKHHLNYHNNLAAQKFNIMSTAVLANDLITAKTYGEELLSYSDRTPYPRLAAILLAKIAFIENNLDQAVDKLYLVVNKKIKDPIWHISNLRLIKILLIQNNLTAVKENLVNGLELSKHQEFYSRYHELQGDLLVAEKDLETARSEYSKALKGLPPKTIAPWLEVKMADF